MTNTTVNAIEMVQAAGVTTVEEIRLFAMETRSITKDVLAAGIVELGFELPSNKKARKIVFADMFARAYEMEMGTEEFLEESAAGETPVAEATPVSNTTTTEEEVTMTNEIKLTEVITAGGLTKEQLNRNEAMLHKSKVTRGDNIDFSTGHAAYENPALKEMLAKVNAAKNGYVNNVGENAVTVEHILFYAGTKKEVSAQERKERQYIREVELANGSTMRFIGEVTVRLPKNYAQIKVWNPNKVNSKGKLGAPEFIDFDGYDLNLTKRQYNMRRPLAAGSNLLVLSIYEFVSPEGEVSPLGVSLPTEKGKDGTRYPIFQTNDARFVKTKDAEAPDTPLYVRDNNDQFNAQVTAFVQMTQDEFVQMNPENHHGFDKKSCTHMVRFQTKDGVMDDEHMDSKKSRVILEQPDVMQLAQVGSEQPNTYCMTRDKWLDMEAVEILNDAEKMDREGAQGRDEDGEVRFQRHDEITIAGKLVKRNTVREEFIKKECESCPFYCGNAPKEEAQVSMEKTKLREAGVKNPYVSPFYREKPKANAQAIQTLVVDKNNLETWVTEFPYNLLSDENVKDILGFRVYSPGVSVYGSDAVMSIVNPEYAVPMEEKDVRHAEVMKLINQIFYAAFNYDKMDDAQHEYIKNLKQPEGMTEYEMKRWNDAKYWYDRAKEWSKEKAEARNVEAFATHFFPGLVTEKLVEVGTLRGKTVYLNRPAMMEEINVQQVMGDAMYRNEKGEFAFGLGYEDMKGEEFVRYLDESAIDYVYEVILDGKEFCLVGGTKKEQELAAGALQQMLQNELTRNFLAFANGDYRDVSFISSIRREENPLLALHNLKVSTVVKGYIAEVLGLLK